MAKRKLSLAKCACRNTPKAKRNDDNKWFIVCPYCKAQTACASSKDEAANLWNHTQIQSKF